MALLAFFPLNTHLGTMYIQYHLSAIATTFFQEYPTNIFRKIDYTMS